MASLAATGSTLSPRTYKAAKVVAEIAVPVAIIVAWQVWADSNDSRYFPPPLTIFAEFQDLWLFSQFGTHVVPSLERILLGFGIGSAFGIAFGIPLGLSVWSHRFAMPHIEYWRAMPPPALLPISVVLLHSIGNLQKVSLIAFFCFFPVLLNTMEGVRGIDPTLIETARSYGVPAREQIQRIVFPAALPRISAGMRLSVSLAVIIMVISEYFSSTSGVGYVLLISKNTFQITTMWAAILLIGIIGYLLNLIYVLAEHRFLAWHRGWRAATPQ